MVERYDQIEYPNGVNRIYRLALVRYLKKRYRIRDYSYMLDVGAGVSDYWKTFQTKKILAFPTSYDLEKEWEHDSGSQDYIFCKSVLEHIHDTQHFLSEARRVLKYGGEAIFLVPDWESQWNIFYDDSTHVKPFTLKGLEQALKLAGFSDVRCEHFYQLPFTWKYTKLKWLLYVLRLLPRDTICSTHVRFSRERMLLCTAMK